MTLIVDDFNRANSATLGTTSDGKAIWTVVNGTFEIVSNQARAVSGTDSIAVIDRLSGDVDTSIDVQATVGNALYFRVTDVDNWWRVRVGRTTRTTTEYEWEQRYSGSPGDHGHISFSRTGWGSYSSPPSFPTTLSHIHDNDLHAHGKAGSPFKTGNTRTVSSGYNYYLYLEKNVAGTTTLVDTYSHGTSTSGLTTVRVRAVASDIKVYANTTDSLRLSVTDTAHQAATGHGFGRDSSSGYFDNYSSDLFNTPPSAPTLNAPVGVTINLAQTYRFDWTFSDPDLPGDSQSQFQLQLRDQGATTPTVDVTNETTSTHYGLAGSTLTAGTKEWRVRTWDAVGEPGPYSAWSGFTAATAPAGPTLTAPGVNETIGVDTYTVRWSAAEQDAYQVRRVADAAGTADTATVYFDTGTVNSSLTRSLDVDFPANPQTEHVQVRVQRNTLWSDWTSARIFVSYNPPETPTVTLLASQGSIWVSATHPTPGAGIPDVESHDVERRQLDGPAGTVVNTVRIAFEHPHNIEFRDLTVGSGVHYAYRVRARGDNGTSTYSEWVE